MSGADISLAHHLADLADSITRPYLTGMVPGLATKSDGSPVTDVDRAVELALADRLGVDRPDDGFLGEEVGEVREVRPGVRRWIVDGIDGTAAFVARRAEWATLIALEDAGAPTLGVASAPGLRRRWWAAMGEGAWTAALESGGRTHAARVIVSATSNPRIARVESWIAPYRVTSARGAIADRIRDLFQSDGDLPWAAPRPPGQRPSWDSGHPGGAMLVASGLLEGFVMFGGGPWDHATTAVMVEEAGGRFSDFSGRARIDRGEAVFSNGLVHEAILRAIDVG